jgi:hypothetical protein
MGPVRTASFQLDFSMVPNSPVFPGTPILPPVPIFPSNPIFVGVTLTFNANGSVAAAHAQVNGPQPPPTTT